MGTWKLSTDPQFVDKVRDVLGLYLSSPQNALVLAVDENSQLQATKPIDTAVPKDLDLHLVPDNYRSVAELEADIRNWINEWNTKPSRFGWTEAADEICETRAAYCQPVNGSGQEGLSKDR